MDMKTFGKPDEVTRMFFSYKSQLFFPRTDILEIESVGGGNMTRKGKQAEPVTEGWKLYQTLQAVETVAPVSYAVRYQTRLPVPGKTKKKNASRKDPSVEYQYQA